MKKIYFMAAAVALVLTACDNENYVDTPEEPTSTMLRISASLDEAFLSRAQGGSWDAGDRIGVITTVGEVAPESFHPYINLEYTAKNSGSPTEFSGPDMLFYNHLTISGYYPYQGSEGTAPGGETDGYLIKTDTRIEKQFEGNNKAIDFLHATRTDIKLADAEDVKLAFSHKMSKLSFSFVNASTDPNSKMDVSKMVSYSLEGLVLTGSFNTLTGECKADEDKATEEIKINVEGQVKYKEGSTNESNELPALLVFPQAPKIKATYRDENNQLVETDEIENKIRLHMYIDEAGDKDHLQHYHCTLSFDDGKLKPGYHYNFKVYVTKVGMILGEMTIVKWDEVKGAIAATIDGNIDLPEE